MEFNNGEKEMIVTDENGEEKVVEILFTFHHEERDKDYVLFFEKDTPDDIIAMSYTDDGDLYPLEDDEEYEEIEEILNTFIDNELLEDNKEA